MSKAAVKLSQDAAPIALAIAKSSRAVSSTELFELNAAAEHGRAVMAKKKKKRERRPGVQICVGSVTVVINGTKPGPWWICWYEFGNPKRQRAVRAEWSDAKRFAEEKATELANNEAWRKTMGQNDWASYTRSVQLSAPTGKPLEILVGEAAEAVSILRSNDIKVSLQEAARCYADTHKSRASLEPKTCQQILDEMILARKADGAFKNTLDDYESRLGRFCRDFNGLLFGISGKEINDWLRKLTVIEKVPKNGITVAKAKRYVTRRTRNNYRDALREFFRFAKEAGYLPKEWAVFEEIVRVKNEPIKVNIFTPEEAVKLLSVALDSLIPYLALSFFSTVRSEELCASDPNLPVVDWRQVNFETKEIQVLPDVARKIGQDRIIPMQPNLIAWLTPHAKPNGPVCELRNVSNALAQTAERAGVTWIRNGPRKSSISYRLAILKNIEATAAEAGTSPERIRLNYKKTIPEREALRWYQIHPPTADGVIQLAPCHTAVI